MNRFYRFYLVLTRQTWGAFNHCGRILLQFSGQLCLWFMPISLKYPHTWSKPWKNKKKSRLFGRGGVPAKTLWKLFFFVFLGGGGVWFFFGFFQGFFGFGHFSAIRTFFYTGRSVSSCVQACRNQSFNHCSYEHTGSEDQDCVFQFWNVRPCPR